MASDGFMTRHAEVLRQTGYLPGGSRAGRPGAVAAIQCHGPITRSG
jgi:hypothetical protein